MNPLWPPSSSSKHGRVGQGRGAQAALAARSALVAGAPAAPAIGPNAAAGNPATMAAIGSPGLGSLQAAGSPAWWTSCPMGTSEGYVSRSSAHLFCTAKLS